jgi:hypothetical protein
VSAYTTTAALRITPSPLTPPLQVSAKMGPVLVAGTRHDSRVPFTRSVNTALAAQVKGAL